MASSNAPPTHARLFRILDDLEEQEKTDHAGISQHSAEEKHVTIKAMRCVGPVLSASSAAMNSLAP